MRLGSPYENGVCATVCLPVTKDAKRLLEQAHKTMRGGGAGGKSEQDDVEFDHPPPARE